VITFELDGTEVSVTDDSGSLLDALREQLGCRSPKDGCSPQGQCGCCTVLVDGAPRVSCVTPARRVAGRSVTTVDGLDPALRDRLVEAFVDNGASQCGFCTPGILVRLAALADRRGDPDETAVRSALLAHLCRCTGWHSIVEAACSALGSAPVPAPAPARDPLLAAWRAALEGPAFQSSGPPTVLGRGGFADDTAPPDALVAVPGSDGSPVVAPTLAEARARSAKVQGRNSTVALRHPLAVPEGEWALTLRTTWVEPAYLEPDASWCGPGGRPASALANGGAFGGKRRSAVGPLARRLADEHGRAVRVLFSREHAVRHGPKRPPIAAGVRADGSGVLRVARTEQTFGLDVFRARVAAVAPGLVVEPVDVAGPPVSSDLRGAGWVEATVLLAVLGARAEGRGGPDTPIEVTGPSGGRARARVAADGAVRVEVFAGEILDAVTLRSYCLGAVHQALGWVWSEGIAVDEAGEVHDLTIRSFGILAARDTPSVEVAMQASDKWPVNGSDAVFAATAAAAWLAGGLGQDWPTQRGRRSPPSARSAP
jgi:aerobic-type carbon monoxide dehydrogenase small subunit (CoxS/CutS family)